MSFDAAVGKQKAGCIPKSRLQSAKTWQHVRSLYFTHAKLHSSWLIQRQVNPEELEYYIHMLTCPHADTQKHFVVVLNTKKVLRIN